MPIRERKTEIPEFVVALGKRIRNIRNERNISIEEVAFKAKIDAQNLRKYELGKQEMKVSMLQRIAEALNMTLDELVKGL